MHEYVYAVAVVVVVVAVAIYEFDNDKWQNRRKVWFIHNVKQIWLNLQLESASKNRLETKIIENCNKEKNI